jgi:predicted alpha/beta hydrolase family esterase
LVGHSCGGGFLFRWLSENNVRVGRVVLVAPWINPNNDRDFRDKRFFKFKIDPNLAVKTSGLIVMYSIDDHEPIIESVNILKSKIKKAYFQKFIGKRHFTLRHMKTEKFPELVRAIINKPRSK